MSRLSGNLRQLVSQAASLLAADPAAAEEAARQVLGEAPADPGALLVLASARRRRGDASGAREILEPLAKAHPRAAMTWYELGAVRAACGEDAGAITALRHALSLKPELADAWQALGELYFRSGDVAAMEAAQAQQRKYALTDPRLRAAADALAANRLAEAEKLLRDHLSASPDDAEALKMLGDTLGRLERHGESETVLARALALAPQFDAARFSHATALFRQHKPAEAIAELRRLLADKPNDPSYRNLLASALSLTGDLEEVERLYAALVAEFPSQPQLWLNYAHALRTIGRGAEAAAAYRRCIALAPQFSAAYDGLANLKLAKFTDAEIAAMTAELAKPRLAEIDRLNLHSALGKALEDRKSYGESFTHYAASAAIAQARISWPADANTERVTKSLRLFSAEFFAARTGSGDPAPDPIFIIGLPRSGSTLIEQVLSSHSEVEGTQELTELGQVAARLARARGKEDTVDCLAEISADALAEAGADYLARTRLYRKTSRPFFIDKMPNNFLHVGLIQLILPNAKIIDARRGPMAACFSAFKQHFAQGQVFSHDLTDLGRYYRDYVALMAHFDAVLPGRVHRVIYENMVEDTEREVRRLLEYCGLEFEPACLRFFENTRPVRTVSSEQVRQPIYRDGLELWKNYEPWLGPLKNALGPALQNWRGG